MKINYFQNFNHELLNRVEFLEIKFNKKFEKEIENIKDLKSLILSGQKQTDFLKQKVLKNFSSILEENLKKEFDKNFALFKKKRELKKKKNLEKEKSKLEEIKKKNDEVKDSNKKSDLKNNKKKLRKENNNIFKKNDKNEISYLNCNWKNDDLFGAQNLTKNQNKETNDDNSFLLDLNNESFF